MRQLNHQQTLKRILHPDFTRKTSWYTRNAHSIILYPHQTGKRESLSAWITHDKLTNLCCGPLMPVSCSCGRWMADSGRLSKPHPGSSTAGFPPARIIRCFNSRTRVPIRWRQTMRTAMTALRSVEFSLEPHPTQWGGKRARKLSRAIRTLPIREPRPRYRAGAEGSGRRTQSVHRYFALTQEQAAAHNRCRFH
jgi:hypothetical protein